MLVQCVHHCYPLSPNPCINNRSPAPTSLTPVAVAVQVVQAAVTLLLGCREEVFRGLDLGLAESQAVLCLTTASSLLRRGLRVPL